MKKIEIVGKNYFGNWTDSRTACRAIIVKEGKILLSYETVTGQWMLPGGGLEKGEDEKDCCRREVAEETGLLTEPPECFLEIDEYYEDRKWINKYFICKVTGKTAMSLTDREAAAGMQPRWVDMEEGRSIFSSYRSFEGKDEMRRGMYLREYTALCESEGNY